jgi:RNA polymerase sigma-70 factor (ECF subfamily)
VQFEALYGEHFATIWRAVQRFGVSERDAADATQEVFVIAHRRLQEFEGRSSLRTWLFGIAFRVAAARRRHVREQREVLEAPGTDARPDLAEDPEAAVMRRELRGLLQLGLNSLPLEQRAVFTMFELEGFSGEEIALALQLPVGTVRSRLRLARATFSRVVKAALETNHDDRSPRQILEAAHDRS